MNNGVAQIIFSIVPIVGIGVGGIIVFFYILWRHHEIKLRIRTGTYKEKNIDLKTFALLTGLLLTFIGGMLTILFAIMASISYALLGGLIPLAIGIALLVFYNVNPDFKQKNDK